MAGVDAGRGRSGRSALEVARLCAAEGGRIALGLFGKPQEVVVKGRGNVVTRADFEVEACIHRILEEEFPEHAVLSEETRSEVDPTGGWVWVVDPLDGTKNYASGVPFFCVNVGLCLDGEPVLGVTFDPCRNEWFVGERGSGATVNEVPLRASTRPAVSASVIGVDLGYSDQRGKAMLQLVHDIFPDMQGLRIPGSAALGLAYTAAGRFDLYLHNYLFPWDIAAGLLLVREAGGIITDRKGKPIRVTSRGLIAGGGDVHADFLRLFGDRPVPPR